MAATLDYWQQVLADSPVLYWRCNELGGTSAMDLSGLAHTGTIAGNHSSAMSGPDADRSGPVVLLDGRRRRHAGR